MTIRSQIGLLMNFSRLSFHAFVLYLQLVSKKPILSVVQCIDSAGVEQAVRDRRGVSRLFVVAVTFFMFVTYNVKLKGCDLI